MYINQQREIAVSLKLDFSLKRSLPVERQKKRYSIKLLLFSIALKKLLTGAVKLNQVQLR